MREVRAWLYLICIHLYVEEHQILWRQWTALLLSIRVTLISGKTCLNRFSHHNSFACATTLTREDCIIAFHLLQNNNRLSINGYIPSSRLICMSSDICYADFYGSHRYCPLTTSCLWFTSFSRFFYYLLLALQRLQAKLEWIGLFVSPSSFSSLFTGFAALKRLYHSVDSDSHDMPPGSARQFLHC